MSGKLKMAFTARMSSSLPEDLALSTTYIPSTNSMFAVVYGCNNKQMKDIEKRVRRADEQLQHPLLIPGIFAELERTRLVEMVEVLVDKFALRSEPSNSAPNADFWSFDSELKGRMAQQHLNLCLESRDLINHISAVKRQLLKLLKEMDIVEQEMESLSPENQMPRDHMRGTRLFETGARMKNRIRDIMIEYDDRIDDCNMMICNTSLVMQTVSDSTDSMPFNQLLMRVWNHIARKDSKTNTAIALQTKLESSQMRTIALLTMIYLPLSSVAAIFSMDMFNWEAIEGESIVSKHIWLFAVLATGLTLLTVAAWFLGTRREKAMAAQSDEYFDSPQRTHTFDSV
ncbi:hypothetical protein CSPAE12_03531 [Colletotrichum incanum]|nr:hypothetical protein CSPAE12_03531 [Colletotrichum incanum]